MSVAATLSRPRASDVLFVVLLGVVVMLFAGFTAAYLIRRPAPDWTPVAIPTWSWIGTGILVTSSVTLELARRRESAGLRRVSLLLGCAFLAAQLFSWSELAQLGVGLPSTPHGAFYFMLSAVHGLHLGGGLCALAWVTLRERPLRLVAAYWHFMGLVWLYVLFLLAS
ncbi:MAG TPA: cytochrome oxidase subunit III [Planctomycetota bacterium]|nr:cytochrome oxidase subunit III [Planctomycetota bacterium]